MTIYIYIRWLYGTFCKTFSRLPSIHSQTQQEPYFLLVFRMTGQERILKLHHNNQSESSSTHLGYSRLLCDDFERNHALRTDASNKPLYSFILFPHVLNGVGFNVVNIISLQICVHEFAKTDFSYLLPYTTAASVVCVSHVENLLV